MAGKFLLAGSYALRVACGLLVFTGAWFHRLGGCRLVSRNSIPDHLPPVWRC